MTKYVSPEDPTRVGEIEEELEVGLMVKWPDNSVTLENTPKNTPIISKPPNYKENFSLSYRE